MKAEDHKKLGQAVRISIDKKKSGNDLMKTIFVKDQIEGLKTSVRMVLSVKNNKQK